MASARSEHGLKIVMNIHSQDQDLLMLAHEALPLARKLATQVHVVLCPRCRARLTKMEGASRLLADTIRGADQRRWHLPTPRGAVAAARTATAWLAVVAVLLALTLIVTTQAVRTAARHHARSNTIPAPTTSGGCRPDLPSDKCR